MNVTRRGVRVLGLPHLVGFTHPAGDPSQYSVIGTPLSEAGGRGRVPVWQSGTSGLYRLGRRDPGGRDAAAARDFNEGSVFGTGARTPGTAPLIGDIVKVDPVRAFVGFFKGGPFGWLGVTQSVQTAAPKPSAAGLPIGIPADWFASVALPGEGADASAPDIGTEGSTSHLDPGHEDIAHGPGNSEGGAPEGGNADHGGLDKGSGDLGEHSGRGGREEY